MALVIDQAQCEVAPINHNFCARCQIIFNLLTNVLLSWDALPSPLVAAQPENTKRIDHTSIGLFTICFGTLSLSKPVSCDFCAFVVQVINSTKEEGTTEWPEDDIVVMVSARNIGKVENISSPDAAHDDTTKWYKALNFGFFDAKCAAILPPPGTVSYIQPLQEYIIPGHYYLARAMGIVRLIDTDGDETRRINSHRNDVAESHLKLGSARLRPALCDPRMFSRWVKACEKLHHKKCDKFKRQIKHPLRLLNTSNLRLETFDPNSVPRYFTLSYVWGTKKYVRLEEAVLSEVTNTGFRDNVNFHPAVSDAIALMKGMNETYLWVDSLCIIQDSATDKLAQIYQMDSIYANSTLTIVAAGDEQEGLPGICKPRTEISSLQVGNLMFVADACASSESHWSDNTIWSSRAWTLQEYIVSPHRLIFTADQVYWWCQATSWRESTYLASHTHRYKAMLLEPDMPLTEMHTLPVAAFATNSEPKYLSKFGEIVEQYSRRKVTVEMDRLFAFQGVLNTIKAVDPRKDHFWALTTWDFEIELDWSDADPYSSAGEFRPFASHLFPSWSWLSYPSPVTLGTEYARITCFRFFHGATTASLECQRISPMQYKPQPTTTNTPYYLLDISMPAIQAQFPKTTFNADRQIIFWADIARLGVTWNKTLDFFTGRLVTGYDETMFPTLEDQYHCLLCWSAEIDKTETEYDFVSINNRFRGDQRCRLIWMLRWKDDGTAVRAGHGIIMGTVWDSLVKRQRIIVMD